MKHLLRYNSPASSWDEALPIGNGKLGAMVYGNPMGQFQLNEDSVWYGGHTDRNNECASINLNKVRELILNNNISEAEELLKESFSGTPESCRYYQTLGDFYLNLNVSDNVSNYTRFLDIDNALTGYSFISDGKKYTINAFSSHPANCIIISITCDKEKSISFSPRLIRDYYEENNTDLNKSYPVQIDTNTIYLSGKLGNDGLDFSASIYIKTNGGNIINTNNEIHVENADNAYIFITAGTTFRYSELKTSLGNFINNAINKDYEIILNEHIKDFHILYNTNTLSITDLTTPPDTDILLNNPDKYIKELTEIYYHFGRYLLISSSRKDSLPANLQGIWNKDMTPPWGSKYTININAEMNYWPAEICNLSECHLPLFDLMKRMVPNGRITARKMYNCQGIVAHHNTDIWGDTAPVDIWVPGTYWVMGFAWLCTHVWTHYQYTNDIDFLSNYYPIMRESAEFFFDFLIEHDGHLMTCPSVSPENTFILPNGNKGANGIGCTMDNQILYDLFTECIKSSEVLAINNPDNDAFIGKAKEVLNKIKPCSIDSKGRLMEWINEYDEEEPGHRHISHLYGLHPSDQITIDGTPELANAARKSLEFRLSHGGGHTGWSKAWIINHYTKLWDSEKALQNLIELFKNSTLKNLLDNHPPFQIDGNFGATAAIAGMFLQSNDKRIVLLPALPKEFSTGFINGLKAIGNLEIDLKWADGILTDIKINSPSEKKVKIKYQNKDYNINLHPGINELNLFKL